MSGKRMASWIWALALAFPSLISAGQSEFKAPQGTAPQAIASQAAIPSLDGALAAPLQAPSLAAPLAPAESPSLAASAQEVLALQAPAAADAAEEPARQAAPSAREVDAVFSANPPLDAGGANDDSLQTIRGTRNHLRTQFQALAEAFGLSERSRPSQGRQLAFDVLARLEEDMGFMAASVPHDPKVYSHVLGQSAAALDDWADHVDRGMVDPTARLRLSESDPVYPVSDRPIHLNFYAVAGDPLQLGHLVIGLKAAAQFAADLTAWIGAADDPRKPEMTPVAQRHPMIRAVLERFSPLFAFSPIAVGTNFDGEMNLFRLFALNPNQPIIATYLVGDDHYHLINPRNGKPDTLPKLEANMANLSLGHNPDIHKVQVAFIRRENHDHVVPTNLPVHWIDHVGFEASSTMIRKQGIYGLMHAVAYRIARSLGLYGIPSAAPKPQ